MNLSDGFWKLMFNDCEIENKCPIISMKRKFSVIFNVYFSFSKEKWIVFLLLTTWKWFRFITLKKSNDIIQFFYENVSEITFKKT